MADIAPARITKVIFPILFECLTHYAKYIFADHRDQLRHKCKTLWVLYKKFYFQKCIVNLCAKRASKIIASPKELQLSVCIGTFLTNYDVTNRKLYNSLDNSQLIWNDTKNDLYTDIIKRHHLDNT